MPAFVRTPEEILRATERSLYFIRFADGLDAHEQSRDPDGMSELVNWFKTHQPHVTLELIGPSELSGYVCGGIGADWLVTNWTQADVARFSTDWEKPDGGSMDPRFQCFHYSLKAYRARRATP